MVAVRRRPIYGNANRQHQQGEKQDTQVDRRMTTRAEPGRAAAAMRPPGPCPRRIQLPGPVPGLSREEHVREGIHPTYREVVFRDAASGATFKTRSTIDSSQTVEWEDGKTRSRYEWLFSYEPETTPLASVLAFR